MSVLLLAIAYPLTIAVLFYLAFLRPVQQQQKKQRRALASLRVGDEVLTQAGFIARIKEVRVPEGKGPTGPRLGLDRQGGSYVLVEADTSQLPAGTNVDDAMNGAKTIIEKRINGVGVSETEVTREGASRLAIQLPGIDPAQASDLIGKTALLE